MIINNASTDVTTYFALYDSTNHILKSDIAVTDLDLYYIKDGGTLSAKVDATALSAIDSAHEPNKAYNATLGLYRIDWPDAAFNGGVGTRVNLIVVCAGVDTSIMEVELSPDQSGLITALLAKTGITAGGTWSLATILKIIAAVTAGTYQEKVANPLITEILDAEDGTTVIAEIGLTTAPTWEKAITVL